MTLSFIGFAIEVADVDKETLISVIPLFPLLHDNHYIDETWAVDMDEVLWNVLTPIAVDSATSISIPLAMNRV